MEKSQEIQYTPENLYDKIIEKLYTFYEGKVSFTGPEPEFTFLLKINNNGKELLKKFLYNKQKDSRDKSEFKELKGPILQTISLPNGDEQFIVPFLANVTFRIDETLSDCFIINKIHLNKWLKSDSKIKDNEENRYIRLMYTKNENDDINYFYIVENDSNIELKLPINIESAMCIFNIGNAILEELNAKEFSLK